jgi:hypothetical protein
MFDFIFFRCSHRAVRQIDQALGHSPLWAWSMQVEGVYGVTPKEWELIKAVKGIRRARLTKYHHPQWSVYYKKQDYSNSFAEV